MPKFAHSCVFSEGEGRCRVFPIREKSLYGLADLCPIHADDAIAVASAVIKVGHGDSLFTGRNPVLLGGGIDLEDMSSSGEDRLLPEKNTNREKV